MKPHNSLYHIPQHNIDSHQQYPPQLPNQGELRPHHSGHYRLPSVDQSTHPVGRHNYTDTAHLTSIIYCTCHTEKLGISTRIGTIVDR